MPDVSAIDFERMRNGGARTSVRVQPAGTAVAGYQVNLGNRPSLRDIGVVGAPAWTAEQTETWVRTSLSATCPRRLTVFEGGKKDIDKCMEFGDDFCGTALNTSKWTKTGTGTETISAGILSATGTTGIKSVRTDFGPNCALRARCALDTTGGNALVGFQNANNFTRFCYGYLNAGQMQGSNGSPGGSTDATSNTIFTYTGGAWATWEVARNGTTNAIYSLGGDIKTISARLPADTNFWAAWASGTGTAYLDWLTVRKYVAAEPVAGTAQPSALNRSMCQSLNLADGLRACCAA